jgi:excisionase family DNA binding protein
MELVLEPIAPVDDAPLQVRIKRAAELLSVSDKTIDRLIRAGELVGVGHGKLRRVEYASIVAYIARHRDQRAEEV